MWKYLVFTIMTLQISILVVASDNNYSNIPTVTTTHIRNSSSQVPVTDSTCKPQQTKCTCICEVIPDEPPSPTTVSSSSESTSSTVTDYTTSTETTTSTKSNPCSEYESLCPKKDDAHPVYFSLSDCTGYCKCCNGRIYYRSCSGGLHFNPSINVCDHPGNVNCTGLPPIPSNLCEAESSKCPVPDEAHPFYIALPSHCAGFCKCTNGVAVYHLCPDKLHFNVKKNVCDWPANAGCKMEN